MAKNDRAARAFLAFLLAASALSTQSCSESSIPSIAQNPSNAAKGAGPVPAPGRESGQGGLVVSVESNYPPLNMIDDQGKNTGFEIELLDAIARESGLTLRYKILPFEAMFDELQAGQIDVVASGVTLTEARERDVDFTDSYFQTYQAIFRSDPGRCGSKEDGIKPDDVDWKTDVVAVQKGATSESLALEKVGNRPGAVVSGQTLYDAILATVEGRATVTLADAAPLMYFNSRRANRPGCAGPLKDTPTDHFAFAVAKGDPKGAIEPFNDALAALNESGRYRKIYVKWFGQEPRNLTDGKSQ